MAAGISFIDSIELNAPNTEPFLLRGVLGGWLLSPHFILQPHQLAICSQWCDQDSKCQDQDRDQDNEVQDQDQDSYLQMSE